MKSLFSLFALLLAFSTQAQWISNVQAEIVTDQILEIDSLRDSSYVDDPKLKITYKASGDVFAGNIYRIDLFSSNDNFTNPITKNVKGDIGDSIQVGAVNTIYVHNPIESIGLVKTDISFKVNTTIQYSPTTFLFKPTSTSEENLFGVCFLSESELILNSSENGGYFSYSIDYGNNQEISFARGPNLRTISNTSLLINPRSRSISGNRSLFFTVMDRDAYKHKVYYSEQVRDFWTPPIMVTGEISDYSEDIHYVDLNEQDYMVFATNFNEKESGLYLSANNGPGSWGSITEIGGNFGLRQYKSPVFLKDNVILFIASDDLREWGFYLTFQNRNGSWSAPSIIKRFSEPINSSFKEIGSFDVDKNLENMFLEVGGKIYHSTFPRDQKDLIESLGGELIYELRPREERISSERGTPVNNEDNLGSGPRYYSLLIGIDDYQYDDADLDDLENPIHDVSSLKKVLTGKYAFEDQNIIELKNPNRGQIIDSFEELAKKVTQKDNLLIFYAGHGIWDRELEVGYWLPSDAKSTSKANWLSNSILRDYIAGIDSKHTLLISDACFSGSIFKSRSVNTLKDVGFAKIYRLPSRKALTSGTLNTVPDQSKFMEFLIKRLDDNQDQYLTAKRLFLEIENSVLNNTNNVPQYGTIQNAGDEGGDFIFIKRK